MRNILTVIAWNDLTRIFLFFLITLYVTCHLVYLV